MVSSNNIFLWSNHDALAVGGAEAQRAFAAMEQMGKIEVAAIEAPDAADSTSPRGNAAGAGSA